MTALSIVEAAVLGLVEGVTEFLPVSSTGHLLLTSRLLGLEGDGITSFEIIVQVGAIAAVVGLYHDRIRSMVRGVVGRDPAGRRLATCLLAAFLPAAVIGLAAGSTIKERLFDVGPVAVAWIVGGVAMLVAERRRPRDVDGTGLEALAVRQAALVGVAQCLALWPGVSRSLVTILAALAVGLGVRAAVEFSFLLGALTLGAAAAAEAFSARATLLGDVGVLAPAIGVAVAFVSAVVTVRLFLGLLTRKGLAPFGWYRIGIGVITLSALATGLI